jgi:hypothetical protein
MGKIAHVNAYSFMPKHETYYGHIANLHNALQSQHAYQPYKHVINLPAKDGTFEETNVVFFNFVSQLFALLSDPHLNKTENLVVNPQDPLASMFHHMAIYAK